MIGRVLNFIKKYLDKKDGRKEIIADFHTTIIRVDDNFISSNSVMLDEPLMGNIYSLKEVMVAETAQIAGNITSRTCIINGEVYGDILSTDYADIKSTAIINGNIRARFISIEPGSVINGSIRIEGEIDERDLIEKVESRLPAGILKKPPLISYSLSNEKYIQKELFVKSASSNTRRPELNKRVALPSAKNKQSQPTETEEKSNDSKNSWY